MQVKVCGKCGMASDANEPCGVCALRSVLARAEAVCEAAEKLHDYEKEGDGTDWDAHYEALYAALRAWRAGKEEK